MIDKLINENLDYWNHKKWNINDINDYINKKTNSFLVIIKNKRIFYKGKGKKDKVRFKRINKFLQDIIKVNPDLEVNFVINLSDEVTNTKIKTYNFSEDNNSNFEFEWGVAVNNSNVLRIETSDYIDIIFPIFSFNKTQEGLIIFPQPNLINNKFYNDNINFDDKKNNIPIYRYSNIRANLFTPSRMILTEYSFKNNKYLDCKGGNNGIHPGHKQYVIPKVFIKLYKKENILDNNIDENLFYEYFNINNFIKKDDLLKNKYLICCDSWYNLIDYCLLNSILFRYSLKKCCYYEDFIFEDEKDIIIFNENNYKEKYNNVINNIHIYKTTIQNRKNKIDKYLRYDNLVKDYGKLLLEFSKIQKTNQIY